MKHWFPHSILSLTILVTWVLLQQSLSLGTLVLGVILALWLPRLLVQLQPPSVDMRFANLGLFLRLIGRVLVDIIQSNIAVARLVLIRRLSPGESGFVHIPLDITHPYALAMLACIITSTPGTIWVSHNSHRRELVIHVLDLVNEQDWIDNIKQRYEQPLLEIFQ